MRPGGRLRIMAVIGLAVLAGQARPQSGATGAFDRLKALAGVWEADSPAGGKLTDTLALVSKGTAIAETIGIPEDNEMSVYSRDAGRIAMTHFCALTASGNQVRLETGVTAAGQDQFVFAFVSASNLATPADAHMRRMVLRLKDANHFTEVWTKREKGKDTIFTLDFVRR
jgi:hypothetical protein